MYESLLLPWSPPHLVTAAETAYRAAGLLRTKGTIFLLPPPLSTLLDAYTSPPRLKTRMSAGAVALCKHFERGGASSEYGRMHPYWEVPRGSNDEKDRVARRVLDRVMGEAVWRNVMLLHRGVAVYEVRNRWGWGMRWTLEVEEEGGLSRGDVNVGAVNGSTSACDDTGHRRCLDADSTPSEDDRDWTVNRTTFRGFIEPIEGMDHEVDKLPSTCTCT